MSTSDGEHTVPALRKVASGGALSTINEADDFFGIADPTLANELMVGSEQNVSQAEVRYPRLAIMQSLSPEIANDVSGYGKGDIINNVTRGIFTVTAKQPWLAVKGVPGSELKSVPSCVLVPIFKLPNEYIEWNNRQVDGPGWKWKSLDQHDPKVVNGTYPPTGRWGTREEHKGVSPPITTNINWLCAILDLDGKVLCDFIVATFAKTSYKTGKKLTNDVVMASRTSKRPPFFQTLILSTELVKRENNAWYEFRAYPYLPFSSVYTDGKPAAEADPARIAYGKEVAKGLMDLYNALKDPTLIDPSSPAGPNNPSKGRMMQEMIIGSAFIEEPSDVDEPGSHEPGDPAAPEF